VAIFVHLAEGGNLLGGAVLEFLARWISFEYIVKQIFAPASVLCKASAEAASGHCTAWVCVVTR
jgi:hypothetical protein